MVSLPLIHGATRIGFYSFRHVAGKMGVTFAEENPDVWNSLKDVDAELAQIGPFLLDAKPDASVTLKERESGVKIRAASRGGSRLILLANPTDTAREVTFEFAATPDGILKPIRHGTNVASRGGIAKVKLEASGTAALLE